MTIVAKCPKCSREHTIPYKNTKYFRCCGILHDKVANTVAKSALSWSKNKEVAESDNKTPEQTPPVLGSADHVILPMNIYKIGVKEIPKKVSVNIIKSGTIKNPKQFKIGY